MNSDINSSEVTLIVSHTRNNKPELLTTAIQQFIALVSSEIQKYSDLILLQNGPPPVIPNLLKIRVYLLFFFKQSKCCKDSFML